MLELVCLVCDGRVTANSVLNVAPVASELSQRFDVAGNLKVYELVPEANRQRFRTREKSRKETSMGFARELVAYFNRWCTTLEVKTLDDLCNLMV